MDRCGGAGERTSDVVTLRLSRLGPLPLHYQIAEELRRRILGSELAAGSRLPSEADLMTAFGVSRGTVRQALASLRADGLIAGRRGSPATVVGRRLEQPFSELVSFSAWVASLGLRPSGRVVEFAPRPADAEAATGLGVVLGATVFHLVRVRLAGDEPLMIERTTFPDDVGRLLADVDLEADSIYAHLSARGAQVASAQQSIDAVAASAVDARLLRAAPRTPLLRVRRRSYTATGRPLELSEDRYRGDRVSLQVENSAVRPSMERRLVAAGGV
jgi:GntR family transcriptional regulator